MGSGIAEVAAWSGLEVAVLEPDEGAMHVDLARTTSSLGHAVRWGK